MPFIAGSIVVGNVSVAAEEPAPLPLIRNYEETFQSLKEKVYNQPAATDVPIEVPSVIKQSTAPSRSPNYRKKAKEKDNELIQYKESAFLSDMLSYSKD